MQEQKQRRPTFHPTIASGLIVAIAIPACAYASHLFNIPITMHVNIFELGAGGMDTAYPYNISFFANFVAMCLVLNIVFWLASKLLLAKIPQEKDRLKMVVEVIIVGVIITGTMGVVFHWSNDHANLLYTQQYGADTSTLYSYLYFSDEFLGHALQESTLIAYFVVLVILERMGTPHRRITWTDLPWMAVIVGVMAVTDGYAALRSETAIWMLVASIAMLVAELCYVVGRRPKLLESPLLVSTMLANAIVIAENVVFLLTIALSPWYPWLRLKL